MATIGAGPVAPSQLTVFHRGWFEPRGGLGTAERPSPRGCLVLWQRIKGEVRAYPKVHGGPAPQCAPPSRLGNGGRSLTPAM